MDKIKTAGFIILATLTIFSCKTDRRTKGKILILLSNTAHMGDPEKHEAGNNLWEVAPPYHIFLSHGYEVDFASPEGGVAPFIMDPIGISSYTIKFEGFMEKANHSLKPKAVVPEDYNAVFIGGGYGPLFDIAENQELLSIIAKIYEKGGIIGGCGHGPGAFANVKLSNGKFLVEGIRLTGFPTSTEHTKDWADRGKLLPFLVEEQLRKNKAAFQTKEDLSDKHDVVIDQRVITTMFLPSSALVAKEMVLLMENQDKKSSFYGFQKK